MSDRPPIARRVAALFGRAGRIDLILVAAFALIQALVLYNAVVHPPGMEYDGEGHLANIATLGSGRLPTAADSKEFFSPPLPYVLPALLMRVGHLGLASSAKIAQLANVLLSAALLLYVLALIDRAQPGRPDAKLAALGAIALFPVYFRTFAMVRGEPFVALCAVAAAYYTLSLVGDPAPGRSRDDTRNAVALGVALGLATLSRQWGFFLIPAVTVFVIVAAIRKRERRVPLARSLVLAGALTIVVGAWFYGSLYVRFGTVTAFNRSPEHFSLRNQSRDFYIGLGSGKLFSDPIRPSFPNQLLPMFYSDTWGDYWAFFLVRGVDRRNGETLRPAALAEVQGQDPPPDWLETNRPAMAKYLGRVNLVSLLPFALALGAIGAGVRALWRFARGRDDTPRTVAAAFFTLVVLCSALGYFWFVVKYPIGGKGDTVKASYMLHAFPFAALLVGLYGAELGKRRPRAFYALAAVTGLVVLHNLPAMISRFS